jgi:hypothetical protein
LTGRANNPFPPSSYLKMEDPTTEGEEDKRKREDVEKEEESKKFLWRVKSPDIFKK